MANYVNVAWSVVLPAEDRLDTQVLLAEVPDVKWNYVMSSGQSVKAGSEAQLEELWPSHLRSLGWN